MSRTSIFAGPESGEFGRIAEFNNSWGSAMYVWTNLGRKYCDDIMAVMKDMNAFWPIWKDPRLVEAERIAMLSTFDTCLVRAEDAKRVAAAFREFVALHPPEGGACTLPEQADTLDRLFELDLEFTPYAFGWEQTSVSGCRWAWRNTSPDGADDVGRCYDLSLDNDHFWLFESLATALKDEDKKEQKGKKNR